jgi:hypothetical protein
VRQDARVLRSIAHVGGAALAAVVAYFVIPLDRELGIVLAIAVLVGLLLLLVPMTIRHAMRIELSPTPLRDALKALTTLLTLLIVGFATVHYTLARNYDGEFDGIHTKVDSLYFTVTVISTVGFGDITAIGQTARVIVTLQMIFDLLFIGLAVRLLGQVVAQRREGIQPPKP